MPSEPHRIYWDSCVYISCIERTAGRDATLRAIVKAAEGGGLVLIASTLVIAEVTKINDPSISATDQAELIRKFFENDYIRVRAVDRRTAEEAADISRQTGLKPADAIHVATAIRWKCECLQTYDGEKGGSNKLLAFDGRIGSPPLKIELPVLPPKLFQPNLFDQPPAGGPAAPP